MNNRQEGIAFLIWHYAEPQGWNVTYSEVAEHLQLSHQEIATISRIKGWANRFRTTKPDHAGTMRFPTILGGFTE